MIENEETRVAEEQYSANSIQVLEGLEAVRKRPSMYIGDIAERGLHHLVYEVVDNSIDEAMAGFCDEINVTIEEDNSIRVQDNGRGIPTDMHPKEHRSALEVVLTVLHAGGKFSKDSYKVSGGLHGVGVSCVNALSDLLVAEVHREGQVFQQRYSKGKPLGPVEVIGTCNDTGTIITFHPDATIFTQTTVYKYDTLANRLRELSFLNKGIKITLRDLREMVDEFKVDENGNNKATGNQVFRPPHSRACLRHIRQDHPHRYRPPVQRRLYREDLFLRQQHQHHRRRYAPPGLQDGSHPFPEELCRPQQTDGEI